MRALDALRNTGYLLDISRFEVGYLTADKDGKKAVNFTVNSDITV
jgi:hypothetical protein